MAGVKGRSGGARANTGPKPRAPVLLKDYGVDDPLDFLLAVMKDPEAPATERVRSAISATQYVHVKTKDGGKKIIKGEAAEKAGQGKFAPGAPPRLVVDNKAGK